MKKWELVQTHRAEKAIRFSFPPIARSGTEVAAIRDMSKWFGHNILYENINLRITRGERIAIIGPNGCGKTTILKIVAGELAPNHGKIHLGHQVNIAYFAQHHSDHLNPQNTIVEEVYQSAPNASVSYIRSVCGAFLFSGKDVDKSISVLSGGERARVSLARLLVCPGNFMLMDEPTNHLDIQSSEALIDALSDYQGSLLFVSHNQSFVNRLATKIWDIRNREVVEYPGTLNEYYEHLARLDEEIHKDPTHLKNTAGASNNDATQESKTHALKRNRKSDRRKRGSKTSGNLQDSKSPSNRT